ncbi:MAG: DUF4493 domain-containing protein [Bacteroidales bacterium]|nr:DUF4493 domain-containing protein [Bacteroidales bacterium]
MNKKWTLFLISAALLLLGSCNENMDGRYSRQGGLFLSDLAPELNEELNTKGAPTPSEYYISVLNEDGDAVVDLQGTLLENLPLSTLKAQGKALNLMAGNYSVAARTAESVPVAGFDCPVYAGEVPVTVVAGETTTPGQITCKLAQCKVTIEYDDQLLAGMTGPGNAKVEVTAGSPLDFPIQYANSKAAPETRAGYFSLPSESSSMIVSVTAVIGGKSLKMSKAFTGIKAAQWRQITLIPMVNPEGTATFDVRINGYVDDGELLSYSLAPAEEVIGTDPKAPTGDGGITLDFAEDCTMFDDLKNIVVPDPAVKQMDLRLVAVVPNGVKKFTVHIETNNPAFQSALAVAGGADLDLINPSADAAVIFEVVPFPHGADLVGQTRVNFDLGAAQGPIYGFEGRHTFYMTVTDLKGCKKTIEVSMVIG